MSKKRNKQVGGQAVLGRQLLVTTPWLTERHGYDPTYRHKKTMQVIDMNPES